MVTDRMGTRADRSGGASLGGLAERQACAYLQAQGLQLVARNFRSPGRGGGEIDLIMRDAAGTLVFVEVRYRARARQGGAAASIGRHKQRRIVWAARHFLRRCATLPPCRFDAVVFDGPDGPEGLPPPLWLQAAFEPDRGPASW